MPMKPATAALVTRLLKLREATGRAALAAAQHEHTSRAAAATALAHGIADELASVHDPRLAFTAWRAAAAARLAEAHHATTQAEAACTAPRDALADTLRARRGLETLLARQAEDHARLVARRDPLAQLMALPAAVRL